MNEKRRLNAAADKNRENVRLELLKQQNDEKAKLNHQHQLELTKQENEWAEIKKQMTQEFNHIKDGLQDRIVDQEANIVKWKEKWSSRGPRPEDKERIRELSEIIAARDETIESLVKDKRFYQEELANRDRNFTKIFTNGNVNGFGWVDLGFQF